jgi:hypothetical protein
VPAGAGRQQRARAAERAGRGQGACAIPNVFLFSCSPTMYLRWSSMYSFWQAGSVSPGSRPCASGSSCGMSCAGRLFVARSVSVLVRGPAHSSRAESPLGREWGPGIAESAVQRGGHAMAARGLLVALMASAALGSHTPGAAVPNLPAGPAPAMPRPALELRGGGVHGRAGWPLRGGGPGALFRRLLGQGGPGQVPHQGGLHGGSRLDEPGSPRVDVREATKTMQTLDDEQCLQHIERWKRSGQAGGPVALLNGLFKGSCFRPEESDDDHDDDAGAWFAVLTVAVERGHSQTLRRLVSQGVGGILVDARGRHGQTALHIAAARGRQGVIDVLCDLGADVEATDLLGWSALHQAAYHGQTAAAQHLVEKYHAAPGVLTSAGLTPLALAEEQLRRCENSASKQWGSDASSARNLEANRAGLKDTVAYLQHVTSSPRASRPPASTGDMPKKASAPQNGGQNKLAGLLRRIATVGRKDGGDEAPLASGSQPRGDAGSRGSGVGAPKASPAPDAPRAPAAKAAASPAVGGDMCGVGITLNINMEGEYLVKAVAPGGPADVMDEEDEGVPAIQPGDILVSVDGRVVQDASYGDLAGWILGPAGTVVQMKLRRGDESFQLSLSRAPLGDKVCARRILPPPSSAVLLLAPVFRTVDREASLENS